MQISNHLPETGYLRLWQIVGKPATVDRPGTPGLIPVSRSTWWAGVRSGRYPQPTRALGPRITAWAVEDIRALIESVASAKAAA
ncbi:putative DNA-binding transcriptional regulator AlpA [Lysobacter niastensis]|uniref:DNA-binding transcriptional regulator AlpA n=1 Tax=Lysobacter niastensis TaxID=380629 RepID=A0ABU1WA20_9GAMM|nr:putative DNA-binding transcriptional regulator AlpA [Lysobacter niastensis]